MRLIILSIVFLYLAPAWSDEPGDQKAIRQQQANPKQSNQSGANPPNPREQKKADSDKKQAEKLDHSPDEKLSIDRQLVEYTRQLAAYTQQLSKWTAGLVLATVVLGALGLWQGAVATKELMFANRPILVARRFRLHMPTPERPLPMVEFIVANVGNSKAYVTWDNITFAVLNRTDREAMERRSFPPIKAGSENEQMLKRSHYTPTKRLAHAIVLQGIQDVPAAIAAAQTGDADFLCYGFIRYRDALWGRYETNFFRTYVEGMDEMTPHANPDFDDSSEQD